MSSFHKWLLAHPDPAESSQPHIMLPCHTMPAEPAAELLATRWAETYDNPLQCTPATAGPGVVWQVALAWGAHEVQVVTLPVPISTLARERCLLTAHWGAAFYHQATEHSGYLWLRYTGVSSHPCQQYAALYQAARLWADESLLAVVNEPAYTAHPKQVLVMLTQPQNLPQLEAYPPWVFWTGFLQLDAGNAGMVDVAGLGSDGSTWFLTRGMHFFGLPDLALATTHPEEAENMMNLMHDVAQYLWEQKPEVQGGDLVRLDPHGLYELLDGGELQELFGGVGRILILQHRPEEYLATLENSLP